MYGEKRNMKNEEPDDGMAFFKGIGNATIFSLVLWLIIGLVVFGIKYIIKGGMFK